MSPGSGKTHLLYSTANRVRSKFADVGIASVNADQIPREVANLLDDPSPLEGMDEAILLVDSLERFTSELDTLENVIRLFIRHEHFVIVASNTHPKRLKHVPRSLTALLLNGTLCEIHPDQDDVDLESILHDAPGESDFHKLQKDLAVLQAQSVNAGIATNLERLNSHADASLVESLQEEMEALRTELKDTQARLGEAQSELKQAPDRPDRQTDSELDDFNELKLQIENLKGENALLSFAEKESRGLREQLNRVQQELETLRESGSTGDPDPSALDAERARLDAEKADLAKQTQRLQELKDSIEEANQNHYDQAEAHESLQDMQQQLLHMLSELELSDGDTLDSCVTAIRNLKAERIDLMEKLTQSVEDVQTANDTIDALTGDVDQYKNLLTDMEMAMEVLRNEGSQGQLDLKGQITILEESLRMAEERETQSRMRDEALSVQLNEVLETISKERGIPLHELSNDPKIIQLKSFSKEVPASPRMEPADDIPSDTENDGESDETSGVDTDAGPSTIVPLESRTMHHVEELESEPMNRTDENQTA